MEDVLAALLRTEDPPSNYALSTADVAGIAGCYDWESRVSERNWSSDTEYKSLAEMIDAEPYEFLADISRYYGDDYYLDDEVEFDDDGDDCCD